MYGKVSEVEKDGAKEPQGHQWVLLSVHSSDRHKKVRSHEAKERTVRKTSAVHSIHIHSVHIST